MRFLSTLFMIVLKTGATALAQDATVPTVASGSPRHDP